MIKNYMTYPMKTMRITQSYWGETSHKPHWYGATDYKDYPIDDGGKDTGQDPIYCPCDEMKVTAIKGIGNPSVTNTIWLVSTSPVVTPTFTDIAFMTLTHSNDSDLSSIAIGTLFHRGDVICHEGTNGASSNHIHLVCGRGYSDSWVENSNHKWVMKGDTKHPEDVFYIDRTFTDEAWGGYLSWVTLPNDLVGSPVDRNSSVDQLEVLVTNLNARSTPSLSGEKKGYITPGIYDYMSTQEADGYTWYQVESYWIAYQDTWIQVMPKVSSETGSEETPDGTPETEPRLIFECQQSGKYLIYLQKGMKLYLK